MLRPLLGAEHRRHVRFEQLHDPGEVAVGEIGGGAVAEAEAEALVLAERGEVRKRIGKGDVGGGYDAIQRRFKCGSLLFRRMMNI